MGACALPLILNDAAPRRRLRWLLWDLSRSARLSKIADRFWLADRGFAAGNDHRDWTSLRDSWTHPTERVDKEAAAAAAPHYYQLGMPREPERCFHRIISRDRAAIDSLSAEQFWDLGDVGAGLEGVEELHDALHGRCGNGDSGVCRVVGELGVQRLDADGSLRIPVGNLDPLGDLGSRAGGDLDDAGRNDHRISEVEGFVVDVRDLVDL